MIFFCLYSIYPLHDILENKMSQKAACKIYPITCQKCRSTYCRVITSELLMTFVFFFILFYIFQFPIMNMYCFQNQRKNKYYLFPKKKTKIFQKSEAGLWLNSMCSAFLSVCFELSPTDRTPSSRLSSSFSHPPGSLSD